MTARDERGVSMKKLKEYERYNALVGAMQYSLIFALVPTLFAAIIGVSGGLSVGNIQFDSGTGYSSAIMMCLALAVAIVLTVLACVQNAKFMLATICVLLGTMIILGGYSMSLVHCIVAAVMWYWIVEVKKQPLENQQLFRIMKVLFILCAVEVIVFAVVDGIQSAAEYDITLMTSMMLSFGTMIRRIIMNPEIWLLIYVFRY